MRILHTSDWHLGASLYDASRYDEQKKFLDWLIDLIVRERIDALLVAGDVFDKVITTNEAESLYYTFLAKLCRTDCRQTVIIGGNHDSPAKLNAPASLLKVLGAHVIGCMPENPTDEIIALTDKDGTESVLVCAVPYLRDRDVRTGRLDEDPSCWAGEIAEGVAKHYRDVFRAARDRNPALPVIAMGHLFASGARVGDGEKGITVGTLGEIPAESIAEGFAYVALGHIHSPQKVGKSGSVRYCGSPIAMSFDETRPKEVVILDVAADGTCTPSFIPVPAPRDLMRLRGSLEDLRSRLRTDVWEHPGTWIDIECTEGTSRSLRADLEQLIADEAEKRKTAPADRPVILHTKDVSPAAAFTPDEEVKADLSSLTEKEVFEKLLERKGIPEEEREELRRYYGMVLRDLIEDPDGKQDRAQHTAN